MSKPVEEMEATFKPSKACCSLPAIVTSGYKYEGEYVTIGGMKTYVSGSKSEASKGILMIMDIFGFFDQTVQGADLLAQHHEKYVTFMPDAFNGEPLPFDGYPADTPEKEEALNAFFGKNPPDGFADKIPAYLKAAQEKYPQIESWGIIGYCWGAKVTSIAVGTPSTKFRVAAECHPAMVEAADAEKIKIPLIMLASGEEDAKLVEAFKAALTAPHKVETYKDQVHGWMSAKADLKKEGPLEGYKKGYEEVLTFFHSNW